MRFPYLKQLNKNTEVVATFGGINQLADANSNEFLSMQNISTKEYPAVTLRDKRGVKQSITDPKGFLIKNGTFWIDGTTAHYKYVSGGQSQEHTFSVSNVTPKIIVGMGAYIVIFPDKIRYNTSTRTTENLESSYTQSASITFAPYSTGSAYTKITATDIDDYFSAYDNVTIAGCTDESYNSTKIISEVGTDYIVVTGALTASFTQSSGLTFKRNVPDMDYVIERDNRLWGCSSANHEVYSCKLGDAKNWYNYEGLSDDAYAATIASDGDFTGIAKYSSYLIFFKEHTAHILRGDKPANYSITEKQMVGVKNGCSGSVCNVNDVLYYVGYDGVYQFTGGTPQKISRNITDEISDATCGENANRLYVSADKLYVYDTINNIWTIEDTEEINSPQSAEGNLYYIDGSNNLTTIKGSRNETIDWELESVVLRENSMDNKYVSKIRVMIELDVGSDVIVYARFDGGDWVQKGFVKSTAKKTYTIPVTPRRCSTWQYRLEGRGSFKLLAVSRDVEGGSDINGYIQSQFR